MNPRPSTSCSEPVTFPCITRTLSTAPTPMLRQNVDVASRFDTFRRPLESCRASPGRRLSTCAARLYRASTPICRFPSIGKVSICSFKAAKFGLETEPSEVAGRVRKQSATTERHLALIRGACRNVSFGADISRVSTWGQPSDVANAARALTGDLPENILDELGFGFGVKGHVDALSRRALTGRVRLNAGTLDCK